MFCGILAAREWSASPAQVPERESFAGFPLSIGQWSGTKQILSPEVLDSLAATDAFHAIYTSDNKTYQILLLLVYYEKQDSIAAAHAPTSCLLGSGWSINQKAEREPTEAFPYPMAWMHLRHSGNSLISNFWFQQRGRYISNELMNKWRLFTDSFTMRRTDGALVRLELVHTASMTTEQGQKILDAFAKEIHPLLPQFIPGK